LVFGDGVFCVGDGRNEVEPGFLRYALRCTIPDHRLKLNDLKPDMLKGPARNERECLCGNTFIACPCGYPVAGNSLAVFPIDGAQSDCANEIVG
jgi:hypothetical protein